jgi:hypothetical protein
MDYGVHGNDTALRPDSDRLCPKTSCRLRIATEMRCLARIFLSVITGTGRRIEPSSSKLQILPTVTAGEGMYRIYTPLIASECRSSRELGFTGSTWHDRASTWRAIPIYVGFVSRRDSIR